MASTNTLVTDPVCGMMINTQGSVVVEHDGLSYHFCESACAEIFEEDPERWVHEEAGGPRL